MRAIGNCFCFYRRAFEPGRRAAVPFCSVVRRLSVSLTMFRPPAAALFNPRVLGLPCCVGTALISKI